MRTFVEYARKGLIFREDNRVRGAFQFWGQWTRNSYRSYSPVARLTTKRIGHLVGKLLAASALQEQLKQAGDYQAAADKADTVWSVVLELLSIWGGFPHTGSTKLMNKLLSLQWVSELNIHMTSKGWPIWRSDLDQIPGHFARRSSIDPSKIAFYRDGQKLLAGIQTQISPGKYLAQYYPNLTAEEVKQWANRFSPLKEENLVLLEDGSDIVQAYEEEVSAYSSGCSCMLGEDSVKIYNYPGNGVRLATIWEGKPFETTLLARSLVRIDTEPMQYIRGYTKVGSGTSPEQFEGFLQSLGYVHGNLNGVKLRAIPRDDGYLCPYVDSGNGGDPNGEVYGDYILVGGGPYDLQQQSGVTMDNRVTCECCGDYHQSYNMNTVHDGEVCDNCLEQYYVEGIYSWRQWRNYRGTARIHIERSTQDKSTGMYVLDEIMDEAGRCCESCGDYHSDGLSAYVVSEEVEHLCGNCLPDLVMPDFPEQISGYAFSLSVDARDVVEDAQGRTMCVWDAVQSESGEWVYAGAGNYAAPEVDNDKVEIAPSSCWVARSSLGEEVGSIEELTQVELSSLRAGLFGVEATAGVAASDLRSVAGFWAGGAGAIRPEHIVSALDIPEQLGGRVAVGPRWDINEFLTVGGDVTVCVDPAASEVDVTVTQLTEANNNIYELGA